MIQRPARPKRDRLLRLFEGQPLEALPKWMMRQAGRHLPEYRQTRAHAKDFMALCHSPEWVCEVTLQPLKRYPLLDAAIIFSDILVIPEAMGYDVRFDAGHGPVIAQPLRVGDPWSATRVTPESLDYVYQAIRSLKPHLEVPLIGFCGSPYTVSTYMIEGGSSKSFQEVKRWMYAEPEGYDAILRHIADWQIAYCKEQVRAGADVLMIFDSWGGMLSAPSFQRFSYAPMQHMLTQLRADPLTQETPVIVFSKGLGHNLGLLNPLPIQAVGLDWTVTLAQARNWIPADRITQGNFDPGLLYAPKDVITEAVTQSIHDIQANPRHIFNLGHGILTDAPIDHVTHLLQTIETQSAALMQRLAQERV